MENKKSRWELKYEDFLNGSVDKDIETMRENLKAEADKFNEAIKEGKNSEAQKAQDEINKLEGEVKQKEVTKSSVTANQSKIENILQLKKDLIKDSADLIGKQENVAEYEKAKKLVEDNDKELKNLKTEIESIDVQIKQLNGKINDPATTSADRAKFEQDKAKLNEQRKTKTVAIGKLNSDKYAEARATKDRLEAEVGTYNLKAIKNTLAKNEKLIAKCDLIGTNLVNGKSMEEINASLKKFKFTPNKDFAKKVATMRGLYEKEENAKVDAAKKVNEKATEDVKAAYEKAKSAIEEANKAIEEYKKLSNLPAQKTPWYKKVPVLKQITNGISKIFNRGKAQTNVEEARAKAEQARKEAEAAKKEYLEKKEEAEKTKVEVEKKEKEKKDKERSTDYLNELRKQKGENTILEGMALYGDTFKDRLKYKMPNVKSSLTQDQIDKAKSKNNYQFKNTLQVNGKTVVIEHGKDKRAYDIEARKNMIRNNIKNMTGKTVEELKEEKKARQDGDER